MTTNDHIELCGIPGDIADYTESFLIFMQEKNAQAQVNINCQVFFFLKPDTVITNRL